MADTEPTLALPGPLHEDKEPVLALLSQISMSLKELNSTCKDHATRLERLESQQLAKDSENRKQTDMNEPTRLATSNPAPQHPSQSSPPAKDKEVDTEACAKYRYIDELGEIKEALCSSLEGYSSTEVKYGSSLPIDQRVKLDWFPHPPLGDSADYHSWIKENGPGFPYDGRCSFPFDTLALARSSSLEGVRANLAGMEDFIRNLQDGGGFFFFREHHMTRVNKVFNGIDVYVCEDSDLKAVPRLSRTGDTFCEGIVPTRRPPVEDQLTKLFEARSYSMDRDDRGRDLRLVGSHSLRYDDVVSGPWTTYHIGERPSSKYRRRSRDLDDKYHWALTAPWCRLWVITGLGRVNLQRKHPVPLLFETQIIWDHLHSKQMSSKIHSSSNKESFRFQFSWYELVPRLRAEKSRESGGLYRDCDKSLQLQSFMVHAIWNSYDEDTFGRCYFWTLVILAPAFFYDAQHTGEAKEDLMKTLHDISSTLSETLFMITTRILIEWKEIADYVETFIATQKAFLDEKQHDSLLFDDDTFSRSRQYFWAITSISAFIPIIEETMQHYGTVSSWVLEIDYDEAKAVTHQENHTQLKALVQRFKAQQERATALRDALFNASAVVESRLSTRLAQNVKLLTYVSIFYLPLGFCAALWAIPNITDASTRTPFIVTAVLIGFVTYGIVFNLDLLVSLGWTTYSTFRRERIAQMREEEENGAAKSTWPNRARDFDRFEPDRGKTKPSEWYILLYWLLHPFKRFQSPKDASVEDEQSSTSAVEQAYAKKWGPWLRASLKKSKGVEDKA